MPVEEARTTAVDTAPAPTAPAARRRHAYVDNLKVVLVTGVIVGHATLAWTGVGVWVFDEPRVREPLLSILILVAVIGSLFAIPLFFMLAGAFTPGSLERKGPSRFLAERAVRLGLPMLFYILFLSPLVEYVDPDNAGWTGGFARFVPFIWWPPAPGPTWFLGVLLVFSLVYALYRTLRPRRPTPAAPPRIGQLAAAAAILAVATYLVRLVVPLGVEVWRLALGQAPAWVAGFALGTMGAERGWFSPLHPPIARLCRRAAWTATLACAAFVGAGMAAGADIDSYAGGGTWQSLLIAGAEGVIVVSMSLWLIDLFRRRFDRQGPTARRAGRAAYPAFVLHQVVLVGLVLLTRLLPWPPEIEYLSAALAGVVISFGLGALLLRVPGLRVVLGEPLRPGATARPGSGGPWPPGP